MFDIIIAKFYQISFHLYFIQKNVESGMCNIFNRHKRGKYQ